MDQFRRVGKKVSEQKQYGAMQYVTKAYATRVEKCQYPDFLGRGLSHAAAGLLHLVHSKVSLHRCQRFALCTSSSNVVLENG